MKTYYLYFFVLIYLFTSCFRKPDVQIFTQDKEYYEQQSIRFDCLIQDGNSFLWDFGDGTTSDQYSPEKIYGKAGTYVVKLTVFSKNRKKSSESLKTFVIKESRYKLIATINSEKLEYYYNSDDCIGMEYYTKTTSGGTNEYAFITKEVYNSEKQFKIITGTNYSTIPYSESEFKSMFTGERTLITKSCTDSLHTTDMTNGVCIDYVNEFGKRWSSYCVPASQQPASSFVKFEVIDSETVQSQNSTYLLLKVKATFSVKLADNNGDLIDATGEFYFEKRNSK